MAFLAIVDYKTGAAPTKAQVEAGYRLQLGVLGLIAQHGGFKPGKDAPEALAMRGEASVFEFWSLAKNEGQFGKIVSPIRGERERTGPEPERFLPLHEEKLSEAITRFIKGSEPFTARENPNYPGYTEFDQLMRLEEWQFEEGAPE